MGLKSSWLKSLELKCPGVKCPFREMTFQPLTFQTQTFQKWTFQTHGSKIHGWKYRGWKVHGRKFWGWKVHRWKFWGWKVRSWNLGVEKSGVEMSFNLPDLLLLLENILPQNNLDVENRISSYSCRYLFFFEFIKAWKFHIVSSLSFPICNENMNSFLTRWGNYSRRGNYSREDTMRK